MEVIDTGTRSFKAEFSPTEINVEAIDEYLDPGLILLHRAEALCLLVERGEVSIDDALLRLAMGIDALIGPPPCEVCLDREHRRRQPDDPKPARRPTPETTLEAIRFTIRERGAAALKEPDNRVRMSMCDAAERKEIERYAQARGRQ